MNGLSVSELCCLFCCPPCPSKIVAKLAFLPPLPTYKLIINDEQSVNAPSSESTQTHTNTTNSTSTSNSTTSSSTPNSEHTALQSNPTNDNANTRSNRTNLGPIRNIFQFIRNSSRNLCYGMVCAHRYGANQPQQQGQLYQQLHTNAKLVMLEKAEWQYGPIELEKLEVFLTRTDRGHQIACLFVRCTPTPKYTILFSHGNAVDLGQMSSFYYGLGCRLECNVFTYDYSGYGASNGTPTEKNLYSDIQAAWNALRIRYGISPSNIILYGQSIGTVPTVDLASKYDCAGVVLHAPLMSGMRVAFNTNRTWCCDAFPSIDKVSRVGSLVLVIHGTDDEVIDLSHGVAIHNKCQKPVDPLWVEGAGHNDVEIYSQYVERLRRFINEEIRSHQYSLMTSMSSPNALTQSQQPELSEKSSTNTATTMLSNMYKSTNN